MANSLKPNYPLGFIEMPVNTARPLVMHIDMNSCFAIMEQQANPLLRGKPVAVAAYVSPRGCILAPSYEAKRCGVKTGMRVMDGLKLCPDMIVLPPDPPKYRDAHIRFKRIFESYTSRVTPKSIDEMIIDFNDAAIKDERSLIEIGKEIKRRVRDEVGSYVTVNVGLGTNRFLAKTAAGLHKPDGLDVITKENLQDVYQHMDLLDICGINIRNRRRLYRAGITTPLEFFNAPMHVLKKIVFESINGYYWYLRLRGWEIDGVDFKRRSIGHTYALGQKTADRDHLNRLMMKLCEKTGRRLRRHGFFAEAIHVSCIYDDRTMWHHGERIGGRLFTTQDIYVHATRLLDQQPAAKVVAHLAITVYDLVPYEPLQLSLDDGTRLDSHALARALDEINDTYGDLTVASALVVNMDNFILDRIAFGSVKDLIDLYQNGED